jgi:flagellar biosynthesis chaperone FliJ
MRSTMDDRGRNSPTAEMAEVRKGAVERLPYGFTAGRKRARNRFISVLNATIERFQG